MKLEDTPQYKRGREGERRVMRLLKGLGYMCIPSADYVGSATHPSAPKLKGASESLVLPDIDACKDGQRAWVEVKTKTHAVLHRISGKYRHGMERRNWEQYVAVQERTGTETYVVIYEITSGEVLAAPVDHLKNCIWYGQGPGFPRPMVFWERDEFDVIGNIAEAEVA
jgi:hypothetical protein